MGNIFNHFSRTLLRRLLRNDMPKAEQLFWFHVRGSQLHGYKFRRQASIGKYVVDFYCPSKKLIIEIDGDSHGTDEAQAYDQEREEYLRLQGLNILRFTNEDVLKNIQGVLEEVFRYLLLP